MAYNGIQPHSERRQNLRQSEPGLIYAIRSPETFQQFTEAIYR